ncbi:MAG: hypothetical protein E4H02_10670 [Lentisphaerales bacterium]|jgi:ParB family chromosome partitioning protein|nr:MAG: hypothetical protein E4H02_10670 [Lentisphaerales bacterium]
MDMELVEMNIDNIVSKRPCRMSGEDLSALENSIKRLGILFPIMVNQRNILLSGTRRLQACRNIGMTRIPVLRVNVDAAGTQAAEIKSDENLCRSPYTTEELNQEIDAKKSMRRRHTSILARLKGFMSGSRRGDGDKG